MIIPDTIPLTILRGRDFEIVFEFEATNLAGYTGRSQIRAMDNISSPLLEEFAITITPATNSTVRLTLTDAETTAITAETGWFDLLLTTGTTDATFVRGPVTFIGSVTEKP